MTKSNHQQTSRFNHRQKFLNWGLVLLAVVFGSFILSLSVWRTAMTKINERNVVTKNIQKTDKYIEEKEPIGYYLAYSGILPGNIFYPLKMVRDRVNLMLTYGPQARAEKMLLFADKRIAAAWTLFEADQLNQAIGVAFKAEEYSFRAAQEMLKSDEPGAVQLKDKMLQSNLKHAEILHEMENQLSEQIPDNFRAALDYNQRVIGLLGEN